MADMTTPDAPPPADDSAKISHNQADDGRNPEIPENGQADDDLDPHGQRLSDEAARWRKQYRAEETNRMITEAKLAGMQTREVNRMLATKLARAEDFWLATEVTLEDLLGEDGDVDADLVDQAAEVVLENRDHWRAKLGPVGAPSTSVQADDGFKQGDEQIGWDTLLKGGRAG